MPVYRTPVEAALWSLAYQPAALDHHTHTTLATWPDPTIRAAWARRADIPANLAATATRDPYQTVRTALAANPAVPAEILETLTGEPYVRTVAWLTMSQNPERRPELDTRITALWKQQRRLTLEVNLVPDLVTIGPMIASHAAQHTSWPTAYRIATDWHTHPDVTANLCRRVLSIDLTNPHLNTWWSLAAMIRIPDTFRLRLIKAARRITRVHTNNPTTLRQPPSPWIERLATATPADLADTLDTVRHNPDTLAAFAAFRDHEYVNLDYLTLADDQNTPISELITLAHQLHSEHSTRIGTALGERINNDPFHNDWIATYLRHIPDSHHERHSDCVHNALLAVTWNHIVDTLDAHPDLLDLPPVTGLLGARIRRTRNHPTTRHLVHRYPDLADATGTSPYRHAFSTISSRPIRELSPNHWATLVAHACTLIPTWTMQLLNDFATSSLTVNEVLDGLIALANSPGADHPERSTTPE